MKFGKSLRVVLLGGLLFWAVGPLRAQSINSWVQGTAADSTGAVIPDASVVLTNVNTGVSQKTRTDTAGSYSFPSVPLGLYTITVAKTGFATYKLANVNVIVGQRATENATLTPASTDQTVTVNAGALADLLQPESKFNLRVEFFNPFNHTDFADPHNSIGDSQFGVITATQHQPRIIQVAGKIIF